MKKFICLFACILTSWTASSQSSWRIGVTLGAFGNHARLSGGMQNANALFAVNGYGTPNLGLTFRKTLTSHLSFQTGFTLGSMGFEYAMLRNYNLTRPWEHFVVNRVGLGAVSIPATLLWNFNPNCRNVRWFVGGGLSLVTIGENSGNRTVGADEAAVQVGLNTSDYIAQTVTVSNKGTLNGHLVFGIEKLFKRGTMMSVSCFMNGGWTSLAQSSVVYSVNGTLYNHTFSNYNNYCGLALTYYFRNFGAARAAAVAK